jgi:signal transduction histidine kinase
MKKRLRLIITLFSASFLGMVALSFYSLQQFSTLTRYSNQVDHTNKLITQLYKAQDNIKEIDIKERGFMLSLDSTYFYQFVTTADELHNTMNSLKELTNNDETQKKTLILLGSAVSLRLGYFRDNINYIDTAAVPSAMSPYYRLGMIKKDECLGRISEMLQKENTILTATFKAKKYYEQIASNTILYLLAIFFISSIVLFIILIRELRTRIAYQDELQIKLQDLKRSHAELEQIAFAASHDLKEPLRKIKVFGDRLLRIKKDENDEESSMIIERINYATDRMQGLIDDMVNLTSFVREDGSMEEADLNFILMNVIDELEEKIKENNTSIFREVMPVLTGYPRQLHILFKSLLDNSLKFQRAGVEPAINIRADITDGEELKHLAPLLQSKKFHRITVADNGIGFDNQFISKMFRIFQRLHNQESEYEGKGIGLSICQRIMVNHKGYIVAHGHPDVGATFKLFFPIEES